MTIIEVIEDCNNGGVSVYRLANILDVEYNTMVKHRDGESNKVNLKLAKSVYQKLNIVLDGYLEIELKE